MYYYVYIIKDLHNNSIYIGRTNNLVRRLWEHNNRKSKYTKRSIWKLIYFEGYLSEFSAKNREIKLKQYGRVYSQLKRRIFNNVGK